MEKYCIISYVYEKEIFSDYHDISLDEFEKRCKKAIKDADQKGVNLFFKEVYNERIIGNSFAQVEYNFDLDKEDKINLINFITSFFDDWEMTSIGAKTINTLKAVRFLRVDAEMVKIK